MSAQWVTDAHVERLSSTMAGLLTEASAYREMEGAVRNEESEYFATLNERIRRNTVMEQLDERGVARQLDGSSEEVADEILAAVRANRGKINELASAEDEGVMSRLADALLGAIAGLLVEALAGVVPDGVGPAVMDVVVDVVVAVV